MIMQNWQEAIRKAALSPNTAHTEVWWCVRHHMAHFHSRKDIIRDMSVVLREFEQPRRDACSAVDQLIKEAIHDKVIRLVWRAVMEAPQEDRR